MIKPRRLEQGMTVGMIAPASAPHDPIVIDKAIAGLNRLGYHVKEGRHLRKRYGFLAGTDEERLADIHTMFAESKIDAVVCLRGGYGTSRIVNQIDYKLIKKNPKIFIGFSDITMLNIAFLKKIGLVTFSGPVGTFTFADDPPRPFTLHGFLRTLSVAEPAGSIWQKHPDRKYKIITKGSAKGRLVGGNLSLLSASIGTPMQVVTKNRIVFIEDVEEKPYRIDRMLTQMIQARTLVDAAGIVIGRNVPEASCEEEETAGLRRQKGRMVKPIPRRVTRDFEPVMSEVFAERLGGLGIPILLDLPFGHIKDYATLPEGIMSEMSTDTGDLVITESAVR